MKNFRQLLAHRKGVLGGRPDGDAVLLISGQYRMRLHGVVINRRNTEGVFKDVVSLSKAGLNVAPFERLVVTDIRIGHMLHV